MRTPTLSGPVISIISAITLSALLLAGCPEHQAPAPVRSCGRSGPSKLKFHAADAHLKQHVLDVTGTENGGSTSSVQWCDLDSPATTFTVTFPDGSPIASTSVSSDTSDPNNNCTKPADINVYAQNANQLDGYRYVINITGQTPIGDPHVIVVGGSR